MTRITFVAAAAALAAVGVLPAAASDAAVCTFEATVAIEPGVSTTPHTGTFHTTEPGTIECTGTIMGTGSVTFEGVTGTLGGGETCAGDFQGSGTLQFTVGSDAHTGTFTFSRLAVAGAFTASTSAGDLLGVFEFQPAEGQDCVTTPVTEANVTGQALLADNTIPY